MKTLDLFEEVDQLPEPVQVIVEYYALKEINQGLNYKDCEDYCNRLEQYGYTFSYGLDAVPFNLKEL